MLPKKPAAKIARITTVPLAFVHILKQLHYLKSQGIELELISSDGGYWETVDAILDAKKHIIEIPREIRPWKDLVAFWRLFRHFRRAGYDIVHSTTPKAGLLVALSARLAGVPVRIHTFGGQRWATMTGYRRILLRLADRIICRLDTQVYADSPSQAEYLIAEGITARNRISVLHRGSLGGIDLDRFDAGKYKDENASIRKNLGLSSESVKILFVGRITKDKGIMELVAALVRLTQMSKNVDLILVGPFEPHLDPLPPSTLKIIQSHPNIHTTGFQTHPEHYYGIADVFCLPSYREGFCTAVMEAAAMGLPTIGTRIPGLVDSVADGKTGILVTPHDTTALVSALTLLIDDKALRHRMGADAKSRAVRDFDCQLLAEKLMQAYESLRQ